MQVIKFGEHEQWERREGDGEGDKEGEGDRDGEGEEEGITDLLIYGISNSVISGETLRQQKYSS